MASALLSPRLLKPEKPSPPAGVVVAVASVAASTGLVAELARARSREAEQRRREADLASEMAQLLLGAADLEGAMRLASSRLAVAVGVASATISLRELEAEEGSLRFGLRSSGRP